MTVEFSRYGDPVAAISLPQPVGAGGELVLPAADRATTAAPQPGAAMPVVVQPAAKAWIGQALAGVAGPLRRTGALALAMVPVLALLFLLFMTRRRSFYVAVVSALILVMVSQPLLEAGKAIRFGNRAAEAAPLTTALQSVGATPAGTSPKNTAERVLADLLPVGAEADDTLRDCRALFTDAGYDPLGDEDQDGLDNATEWCLGTDFRDADTDHDTITDTVELAGFTYNNKTWTTDPREDDSNRDGILDGSEWIQGLDGVDLDAVIDPDGDGVPNPWDDDNDGDGVVDSQDISPVTVLPLRRSFDLEVTSHTAGATVYIDIQAQPEITSHLTYNLQRSRLAGRRPGPDHGPRQLRRGYHPGTDAGDGQYHLTHAGGRIRHRFAGDLCHQPGQRLWLAGSVVAGNQLQ
ncbi:MAG: hypothetical protein R2844_09530 [Caldilineales bacterium]